MQIKFILKSILIAIVIIAFSINIALAAETFDIYGDIEPINVLEINSSDTLLSAGNLANGLINKFFRVFTNINIHIFS